MAWTVEVNVFAERQLSKLDRAVQQRLLNWLADRLISVVDPTAGVTRDRVTWIMHEDDRYFEIIDTGGIGSSTTVRHSMPRSSRWLRVNRSMRPSSSPTSPGSRRGAGRRMTSANVRMNALR